MVPLLLALGLLTKPPLAFVSQDVELVYRLDFGEEFKGDRKEAAAKALEVVRKRVGQEGTVRSDGPDRLVVRTPSERAHELKPAIPRAGTLKLLATADLAVQEEFRRTGKVPPGYSAWAHEQTMPSENAAWAPKALLREEAVVDNRHVVSAEPQAELHPTGMHWVVMFSLDEEGARRFDEAAKELFGRRPQGMIAIVVDGRVHSLPTVMTDTFRGQGQVYSGKDERYARDLAHLLRSGPLPVPLELVEERAAGR